MYDSPDKGILTKVSGEKTVALTFDDGPARVLPDLLDSLKQEDVPATFFWQSRLLHHQRPWRRLLDDGHQIGTHTINHPDLTALSFEKQYQQLAKSVRIIEAVTGTKVRYFRPPFGQYNETTKQAAQQLGLTTVLWKVASIDWELKNEPQQIITNVTEHLEDGAIILLHELQQTAEILPELIQAIRQKGYTFRNLPN
ncbi:polysaccharide deacetylase family protein [Sediminibacillus albus]|uniref:polysaccharide deacetylase family protein n=1 Tax=Sediminibacillus albus TaxID=407036 RepID=UPI001FE1FCF5|nr:polysaccharide deacetylase family protein [Sediminibacillus albus]